MWAEAADLEPNPAACSCSLDLRPINLCVSHQHALFGAVQFVHWRCRAFV